MRLASVAATAEKHTEELAEAALEAKMTEKELEVSKLRAWLDEGQASWKDQQVVISQLHSRVEEYRQQIWERQKDLDGYKHFRGATSLCRSSRAQQEIWRGR